MNTKIILVVLGEPNSIFSEILIKYLKSNNFKKTNIKLVLIGNYKLFIKQMKKLKFNLSLNLLSNLNKSLEKKINIVNVNYLFKDTFSPISSHSNKYIEDCFNLGLKLMKEHKFHAMLNGPISKKHFLKKKFPGITEYLANKTKSSNPVMLIYNKNLGVNPLTTHIPIKNVSKMIKKKKIINNVTKINNFYKSKLGIKPKFAILGLNPHCESIEKVSEEKKEIIPAIKDLESRNIFVEGPFPADTFFLNKNIKKYDLVIGMYHDQVLTPVKTLFKFKAINITIGLPFIKVTPDHGPNFEMVGKNKSDPSSIFYAFDFLKKLK